MKEKSAKIKIRPPEPDEYAQVIKCITEARGAGYYSKEFYDIEYLSSGEHEIYSAFDDNGIMVGVTGISASPFETEKSMLSLLNIRPQYTGKGIGSELLCYSVDLLQSRGAGSVKGQVITRYTSIQKVLEGLGLKPTGILPDIRDGRNAVPPAQGKCSLAVYVRSFSAVKTKKIFIPGYTLNIAEIIYSDLGKTISICTDGASASANEIKQIYDPHDDVLLSQVKECSFDLADHLDNLSIQHHSLGNKTELVFLNLCSPSAICGFESLKNKGYVFCGLNPLGDFENAIFFRGKSRSEKPEMTERLTLLYNSLSEVGYLEHT